MTRVGFASCDWSGSVFDANGHPVMGGSGWARLGQYAPLLPEVKALGVLVHDPKLGVFGVREWDGTDHFDLDVIVMQRVMFGDVIAKMPQAKANGQILVNDVDDWYWGLSPANRAFAASHPKQNPVENITFYKGIIGKSDVVTVSTPYLAERLRQWVRCPIEILPNTVDLTKFQPRPPTDATVPLVGWVGSTAHRSGDLNEVRGVLNTMFEKGKIRLHHSGDHPNHESFAAAIGTHPKIVSTLPLLPPADYPKAFVFDVGIVPLTNMPFNRAKSGIKGLEYAASGIPFVASPLDAYLELHAHGLGLIAKKSRYWEILLGRLCDPVYRAEQAAMVLENVQPYDIQYGAKAFSEFLGGLT